MSDLEFNKMFITGGSTVNHSIIVDNKDNKKRLASNGRDIRSITVEKFVKDITSDWDWI